MCCVCFHIYNIVICIRFINFRTSIHISRLSNIRILKSLIVISNPNSYLTSSNATIDPYRVEKHAILA